MNAIDLEVRRSKELLQERKTEGESGEERGRNLGRVDWKWAGLFS
jgi:hypothetical protein